MHEAKILQARAGRGPQPDSKWRSREDGKGFVELAAFDAAIHPPWQEAPRDNVYSFVRQNFKYANINAAADERATRLCVLRVLADRDRAKPAKIAEGPLSLDGAVAMAMLCPEPAWLRVLGFACKWTYKTHMLGRSCEHCLVGELEKRLLRCSRCKTVYFCDRACQRAGHARHRLRCGSLAQMEGDEVTKRQLSDMDPLTMMMADLSFGIQSPESDAYLRAAFDRGIVNQQSHRNAAAVASQVGHRVWKG